MTDRKSTRLNSSHLGISYAVFCLKKKTRTEQPVNRPRLHAVVRGPRAYPPTPPTQPPEAARVPIAACVLEAYLFFFFFFKNPGPPEFPPSPPTAPSPH